MKAVIYARYSSDSQREESIEGQLRECLEFANKIGVDVVANYIDRAMTATSDIILTPNLMGSLKNIIILSCNLIAYLRKISSLI